MKKISTLIFALATFTFILPSCNKDKDGVAGPNPTPTPSEPASEFIVNGIADLSLSNGVGGLGLSIEHVSGTQKTVNLAVHGLPEGMSYDFSSWSGTPTFGTALTFSTYGNHIGSSFPVTLHATNGSVEKEYSFTLYSEPADDCVSDMVSRISYGWIFNGSNGNVTGTVDPDRPNRVRIVVHFMNDLPMYFDVNCFTREIDIPEQTTPSGEKIAGWGEIPGARIDLYYEVTDPNGNAESYRLYLEL